MFYMLFNLRRGSYQVALREAMAQVLYLTRRFFLDNLIEGLNGFMRSVCVIPNTCDNGQEISPGAY